MGRLAKTPPKTFKGERYYRRPKKGYRTQPRNGAAPKYLHRAIYEDTYGSIPDGYLVVFADGNRENMDPGNLKLEAATVSGQTAKKVPQVGKTWPETQVAKPATVSLPVVPLQRKKKKSEKVKTKACTCSVCGCLIYVHPKSTVTTCGLICYLTSVGGKKAASSRSSIALSW